MDRLSSRNLVSAETPPSIPTGATWYAAGSIGREAGNQLRSIPMRTLAPNRSNAIRTAGYMGSPTEVRTPYTSHVVTRGAFSPTSMHGEALHVPRTSIPMRMGMDSATPSIDSILSPPWSPAVNSAVPTVASVSDLGMAAAPTGASVSDRGMITSIRAPRMGSRQHADPRTRPRVMPLEAQAPVLGAGGLDVCFVMDCTSSMAPWLEAAKTTVKDMIEALPTDVPNKRVAFVGYRDFSDGPAQVQRFTDDTESVVRFIDAQDAVGGDDIPEDIAGGLTAALGLDWKAETRTLVLVTDAPCHGQKYHGECDDYPDGDPTGLSMVRLVKALRLSHIDFTMVQLTSKTDKMQKMLKGIYESAAGPENIRKYELRDLRDIIEEAGGEAAIRSCPSSTIPMFSAAVTPTVQASMTSTATRTQTASLPIRTAMIEAIEAPRATAPAILNGARTTEVH